MGHLPKIAIAEKAGVVIKSYGSQPNWSWDYPGYAGGLRSAVKGRRRAGRRPRIAAAAPTP